MAVTINGTTGISTPGMSSTGDVTLAGSGVELLNNSGRIVVGQSGSVLQVVSTSKTDTFSTSSGSWTDVTGLSLTITPSSSSSKILLFATVQQVNQSSTGSTFRLVRDSTAIGIATSGSNRTAGSGSEAYTGRTDNYLSSTTNYLDSPATTSAITYKIQVFANSYTMYINRSVTDTDNAGYSRGVSYITAMEIAQ